jgi:hypothetical protein
MVPVTYTPSSIDQHPDLLELRLRSERATTTPRAQATEALALIAGVYLAASPWITGFNGLTTLAVNNLIAGIAYATLMGGFGHAYERTHAMAWAAAVIGVWTIIAPWVVVGNVNTTRTVISNVVVGAVALLLALAASAASAARPDRSIRDRGSADRSR